MGLTLDYNTNVPNGPNDPGDDQPQMLTNTQSINTWTNVDHVGYNVINAGIHRQVRMRNQALPGPALGDGEGVLYARSTNGNSWPVWKNAVTSFDLMSFVPSIVATGYTTLPGGLIMQWGGGPVNASGTPTPFVFPLAFQTNLFSITIGCRTAEGNSPGANNQFIAEGSQSVTGFSIVNSSSSAARLIYYIALGN